MADLLALQQALGISIQDLPLLEQSLVHGSYLNENPGLAAASNERLEFLGDAVLGLIIAERLYQTFPQSDEGELTKLRANLVRRETLAKVAAAISLNDYLYLGKGEEAAGGRNKPANLAGALEAVIAAVFLDRGLGVARDLVLRLFKNELEQLTNRGTQIDYKSRLQELVQARQQMTPTYSLIEAVGPVHDRTFTVEVKVGDTVLGKGSGKSKKLAEAQAARMALERFQET